MTNGKTDIKQSLQAIAEDYSTRVKEMGTDAKAAGWRDEKNQTLRFTELLKIIPQHDQTDISFADLGCGYGALLSILENEYSSKLRDYHGYDISADMIETAKKAYSSTAHAEFIVSDKIQTRVDYCLASGIFNHHVNTDHKTWTKHIFDTIDHMYEMSDCGLAFNIMTKYVDYEEDYIYYADPADFCHRLMEKYGRSLRLHHDYNLYEFTVFIGKNNG